MKKKRKRKTRSVTAIKCKLQCLFNEWVKMRNVRATTEKSFVLKNDDYVNYLCCGMFDRHERIAWNLLFICDIAENKNPLKLSSCHAIIEQ